MGKYYTKRSTHKQKYPKQLGIWFSQQHPEGNFLVWRRDRSGKKRLVDISPMLMGHYWWRRNQSYKIRGQPFKGGSPYKLRDFF